MGGAASGNGGARPKGGTTKGAAGASSTGMEELAVLRINAIGYDRRSQSGSHVGCMRRWLRRRWQLGPQPEPAPGQLAARARRHGHLARSYERLGNETVLTHTALLTRLHATESHARARTNANA